MTLEEIRARLDEIKGRLQEIDTEYAGQALPDDARAEWNQLNEEYDGLVVLDDEMVSRRQRVEELSDSESNREAGATFHTNRSAVARGDDIYDLTSVRSSVSNPEEATREMHDRAKRAIEGASFPHESVKREEAQGHLERLLDERDSQDGALARRVLVTGSPTYRRAFGKTLAGRPLNGDEQRALSVGTDGEGGFAVPFTLDPTVVLTSDGAVNPLREIARVEQIVTDEWRGVTSAGITVSRAAEAAEASDDAPTLAQPTVSPTRVQGFVPFSVEVGADWSSLQSEIARMLQVAKDEEEADAFINGDGTGTNPDGVVATLAASSEVATASVNTYAVEDIYALDDALPPRYRARARFLANKAVYNATRQFDTSGGADLWVRLASGQPNELIGYPAHEASEMTSDTTTTGAKPLLIGDFEHYLIVDRVGMSVELVPHLFGANQRPTGQRGIYAIWRNSATILADNAFRLLTVDGA